MFVHPDAARHMASPAVPDTETTPSTTSVSRRLPIGVEVMGDGRAHVRVWAPRAEQVAFVVEGGAATRLEKDDGGYFSGVVVDAEPGTRYRFRLDADERLYPDPASRFQPEGPEGPSEIVDPASFTWTDDEWRGVSLNGQVLYELHVGAFTREGTWEAAARELLELAALGVTVVEVMPVADFAGEFGWGYDGVNLFAPTRLYGKPDDFRRYVDRAHAAGLGVILDVVYNHLGPVGNYLRAFSPSYFTDQYENEWGDAINFDGPDADPVRELFVSNAGYWIDEFHLDGLRLDATQQIFDGSPEHILTAVGRRVRAVAGPRSTIIVAENEPQDTRLVRPIDQGGFGLDALWNDDLHHSAIVAVTGQAEAYYSATSGTPQELISAAKYGYLFQGQYYHWQRQPRGTAAWGLPPARFVTFLQNHDQVANSARGLRLHAMTSPGRWRAITAYMLLMPGTPMLFQGQEFAASSPFLYFADHQGELADAVRRGRAEFLTQFPSVAEYERQANLDAPNDPRTFERSKLDFAERETHAGAYRLHRDLLELRRRERAFALQEPNALDGSVLGADVFALRFFTSDHQDDRVLIVNLGRDAFRQSIAEPLLAPPSGADWAVMWSSEHPAYGGRGTADVWPKGSWNIPGECAIVLGPGPLRSDRKPPVRRRSA